MNENSPVKQIMVYMTQKVFTKKLVFVNSLFTTTIAYIQILNILYILNLQFTLRN